MSGGQRSDIGIRLKIDLDTSTVMRYNTDKLDNCHVAEVSLSTIR